MKYYLSTTSNMKSPISRYNLFERGGLYIANGNWDYIFVNHSNFDDAWEYDLLPMFNKLELSIYNIESFYEMLKESIITQYENDN